MRKCSRPDWVTQATEGSKRAGKRFEEFQLAKLEKEFGNLFEPEPWFEFEDNERTYHCAPDGILWLDSSPVIIEIKLSHTYRAWEQLKKLYLPVVKSFYPDSFFRLSEICKTFDPSVYMNGVDVEFIISPKFAPKRGLGVVVELQQF